MASKITLTERESKLMAAVWQCFVETPKLDLEKLATMEGFKTKASANTAWHNLRKKLTATTTPTDGEGIESKAGPASPKKSGRKRTADTDDDADEFETGAEQALTTKTAENSKLKEAEDIAVGNAGEIKTTANKRAKKAKTEEVGGVSSGATDTPEAPKGKARRQPKAKKTLNGWTEAVEENA